MSADPIESAVERFHRLYERLAEFCMEPRFTSEFQNHRKVFFERRGQFYEDDPLYAAWLGSQIDAFMLDHRLPDYGVPVIELFEISKGDGLRAEERALLGKMKASKAGVFYLERLSETNLHAKELCHETSFDVHFKDASRIFEKGEVLQGRVLTLADDLTIFFDSIWSHGRVNKSIFVAFLGQIRECDLQVEDALHLLAKSRFKVMTYSQMTPQSAYMGTIDDLRSELKGNAKKN